VWRVDFGIDGKPDQVVEQSDTAWTGERGPQSAILETVRTTIATEALLNNENKRAWRVYSPSSLNTDGHARGYEVIFGDEDTYEATPHLRNALTFTQNKSCEQYPDRNLSTGCGNQSVIDYANGETLTDPIAWVNVGFHHIVRDEDQSPMPVHWQGFTLYPRDFTAQSPITPQSRADRNGMMEGEGGPVIEPNSPSTTALTLAAATVPAGGQANVTVDVEAPEASKAVGVVRITEGETTLATVDLKATDHGEIDVTLPSLPVGTHEVVARFGGSDIAAASASAPVTLTVDRYTTTTTASLPSPTVARRSPATFEARVAVDGATPAGTVVVKEGTTVLAAVPVPETGEVSVTLADLGRGRHELVAEYQGTDVLAPSTSEPVVLTVTNSSGR
jgi:primary-amine oxidase